ncbi:MAG: hypothetical protein R3B95_19230 [Nitrospirales bacterium]|nr:hypothetical protein [Nitrospirales bacterium]
MGTRRPINFYDCQWATEYIRTSIIFEISLYAKCVRENFLPTFKSLPEQADKLAEEIFWESQRPSLFEDYEGVDFSDLAGDANDRSLKFYIGMKDVYQGFTNLFAAGFYHAFEQHFKSFYVYPWLIHIVRPAWLTQENMMTIEPYDIKPVTKSLKENGIEVEKFSSWETINTELWALTNTVKHGEGNASEKLKEVNPNLLVPPSTHSSADVSFFARQTRVRCPIVGENLFVQIDDFDKYVEAVQSFWGELSDALLTLGNKIPVEPPPPTCKSSSKDLEDKKNHA